MNKTKTKLYVVWRGMKERCTNPNHKNYTLYKDKGYSGWDASDNFINWAIEECIKRNRLCQIKADGFYNKTMWKDPK